MSPLATSPPKTRRAAGRRVVIPGGSGHVGTLLARAFHDEGDDIVVLTRRPEAASRVVANVAGDSPAATARSIPWRVTSWDGRTLGPWAEEVDGAEVVINLAGRSVDCRYTPARRREILSSRVESTAVVGAAIAAARRPPPTWLQMSTATIYAHRFDAANDEETGILGGDEPGAPETWRFSIDVARAWERTLDEAAMPHTRKVALRTAIVMSPTPGAPFAVHLRLVRLGLGGRFGNGRQYVSWVHDTDLVRAVQFLLDDPRGAALDGPVNVAAPNPLPNAAFMAALRRAAGVKFGLPSPVPLLELGAWALRTETELVLKSRRVVPRRLRAAGFDFAHPTWPEAAQNLVTRWRQRQEP